MPDQDEELERWLQQIQPRWPARPRPPLSRLEASYAAWKSAHPHVLALFRRFAEERLVANRPFSAKALAERVRWESDLVCGNGTRRYRFNNSHVAYIARDLLRELPALAPLMRTRRLRTAATEEPL